MAIGPFEDLAAIELEQRGIDADAIGRGCAFVCDLLKMREKRGGLVVRRTVTLFAQREPLAVEGGEHIVQSAAAAGEIRFQHEVAERLEPEHVAA